MLKCKEIKRSNTDVRTDMLKCKEIKRSKTDVRTDMLKCKEILKIENIQIVPSNIVYLGCNAFSKFYFEYILNVHISDFHGFSKYAT